jgi:hypothetical protein
MTLRGWMATVAVVAIALAVPGSVILLGTFYFAWLFSLLALTFFLGSALLGWRPKLSGLGKDGKRSIRLREGSLLREGFIGRGEFGLWDRWSCSDTRRNL